MRAAYLRAALASIFLASVVCCTGCATAKNPRDPLEPLNRKVYRFNEAVDKAVTKPVAQAYRAVVPVPVRGGITNVFGNFRDVTTAINNLLQLKVPRAASDFGRVAINSTLGILGLFDVASRIGLEKHDEDFGQTLGRWGMGPGPYLVLPFLGPSTARDTLGLVGDYFTDPEFYLVTHTPETYVVFATRWINLRANLLSVEEIFNQAALDRYSFLRDAYLQRRRNQIYDGNPPPLENEEGAPHHKTLKEMEEELDLDEPPPKSKEPPAPAPAGPGSPVR
jgi:phospholipid-binding lipoprotein MlaA